LQDAALRQHPAKGERNILYRVKGREVNWIGHILRKDCLLKHIIEGIQEGRTKVTEKRGRICKQLLDDLKGKKGYWKFKEEALALILLNTRFGKRLWTCRKTD